MQLETIRNSMFALSTVQAAGFVGGYVAELQDDIAAPGGSFENQDTFYLNGTVKTDKVEID